MEANHKSVIIPTVGNLVNDTTSSNQSNKIKNTIILVAALVLILASVWMLIEWQPYYAALYEERMATSSGKVLSYVLWGLLALQLGFLSFLSYLYFKYKPVKGVSDDALPTCTVIVPAYNEGKLVYATLKSVVESNYPKDKLEIWAIDDGSSDDTWFWIQRAKNDFGDTIQIFQQPQNMGKRHALYKGFTAGSGDVFITIDSDSIIETDTLRNMLNPFVVNENCGGVAGNVKVLNANEGIIPKMLNVSFVFSFEFVRSAQSALGFVLCTPGALAAYSRKAILPIMDEWLHQSFAGQPSTIGEDRAMTNLILKQGYDVQFQKNAVVYTNTPVGFKNLHKMFTRWGRSNVRESIVMNKFMFKKFRSNKLAGARALYFQQWINILMAIPLLILMITFFLANPLLYVSSALVGIGIFSSIQMLFYSKRYNFKDALWAYPYSIMYMFSLFWIAPYSILTVKNGGWLTR